MEERLKELRTSLGISQSKFANEIQRSPGYISNVETGRGHLSEYTIDIICEKFSVNREWLKIGRGEMFTSDIPNLRDNNEVGKRVKEVRKSHGITQKEFAKTIGYSVDQIYAVECGKVFPSKEFLHKVATTYSISEQWLINGIGGMNDQSVDERLIRYLESHPDVVNELIDKFGIG